MKEGRREVYRAILEMFDTFTPLAIHLFLSTLIIKIVVIQLKKKKLGSGKMDEKVRGGE